MKNTLIFILQSIFYITSLIFLPQEISIYLAIFLVSILSLNKPYYTILPLVICIFSPIYYSFILISIVISHILLIKFIKKNRFYAFIIFILSLFTCYLILFLTNNMTTTSISIILFLIIIYGLINIFNSYQILNQRNYIIPYNQKIIDLIMLLTYFIIIFFYGENPVLMPILFMQLYLIKDYKYPIIFTLLNIILSLIFTTISPDILINLSFSFFPPLISLILNYHHSLWIPIFIYSILITLINSNDKKINFENNYINTIFSDFTKYINQLSKEFNKNNTIKVLKHQKIEEINKLYCSNCHKNSLCKTKLERRYTFLTAVINGTQQNIYDCPNYSKFYVDKNIDIKPKTFEYSGVHSLATELSYLYNQSLLLKDDYEYFIGLLTSYGYNLININLHLSSQTLYFTIELAKNKIIIEELLLKLAYKSFGERLELKTITTPDKYIIHFYKIPLIKLSYAHTILAKNQNLMSGDNYYIKKDYNQSYIFALSDGMGSGYNAYLESVDALNTISMLMSYHFSIKTILKLLEDIYDLKNEYDRYATLDFLYINTANCKMNLYKLGSSTTYILHNHQLFAYENKALPYKLDTINSTFEIDIYSGDYIFLLSDGISDFLSKDEFYSLVSTGTENIEKICDKIIQYIQKKENNNLKDDLSLIAIKAI